jgi:hypothetical protein
MRVGLGIGASKRCFVSKIILSLQHITIQANTFVLKLVYVTA